MNRILLLWLASVLFVNGIHGESPASSSAVSSDILNDASTDPQVPAAADSKPLLTPPNPPGAVPPAVYTPYAVGQKFAAATRNTIGPYALIGVGLSAGYSQWVNTPKEWGQGSEGYAKRFASAVGTNLSNQYFNATLESALHEDPRYFPSTDRSIKARFRHAIAYVFITRKDDGSQGPAYSRWASAIGAGFLANSWNPPSNNHPADAMETAGAILGLDMLIKVGQEFIPFMRHLNP